MVEDRNSRPKNRRKFNKYNAVTRSRLLAGCSITQIVKTMGCLSVVASAWAGAAMAQESAQVADEQVSREDIVVTATKRAENLMNIPVAVAAYSGEALGKMGVSGPQALQIATPAVVYPNTGAYAQP